MRKISLLRTIVLFVPFYFVFQSCEKDSVDSLNQNASDCDTFQLTFSQTIYPIIESNCKSCHSGSAPSAGVSFDSYAGIKAAADNGSLMGTIRHENGWSPMPKNVNQLSACDIRKLEIWIENGSQNN